MFNSDIWPNLALFEDVRLQKKSELEFDVSRSLEVKSDSAIGLPTCSFLLFTSIICLY